MLFTLLRAILWLGACFFIFFKIRRSKIKRKKLIFAISFLLCTAVISVSGMFPAENLFINYESPESVFNYTTSGKIDDIIYGKDSCLIIYSKGDTTGGYYIVPKTDKGYKIPNYFAVKHVSRKFDKDGLFDVYNMSGTDDYYLLGKLISKDEEIHISDSRNQDVKNFVTEVAGSDTKSIVLYAYIENFSNDYYLVVNNTEIMISD